MQEESIAVKSNSIWQPKQSRVYNRLDFDIVDSDLYHCSLLRYTRSHRQLVLEVMFKEAGNYETSFYLWFETLWYFQGPTSWTGIDFELGDMNERKGILRIGFLNIEENMIEAFAQQHELFVLRRPTFTIQILAANCYIVKNISDS